LSSTLSGRALDVSSAAYYFACVLAIEAVRQSHDGDWDAVARKAEAIGMARVGSFPEPFQTAQTRHRGGRMPAAEKALFPGPFMVGDPGFEPGTSALSERRSNRLS
jgi:hypothetical protein